MAALHQGDRPVGDLLSDRNLKFHEYKRKRPAKNVQALLEHIETSGDPVFCG